MKPDIKQKWIEALRSGEYVQGTGCLHNADNGSFCCLGVLCDLADQEGIITSFGSEEDHDGLNGNVYTYDSEKFVLPKSVRDWAGIAQDNPLMSTGMNLMDIAELNDHYRYNFERLAELIDDQL